MTTRNGNLLVANKKTNPEVVAYFKPNFDFIRYPEKKEAEWDWALENWATSPIKKTLSEDPFAWVRILNGVEYQFYKESSKAGIFARYENYWEEEDQEWVRGDRRLSLDEAINRKAGYYPRTVRTAKHVAQRHAEVEAGYLQIWLAAYGESYAHVYMSHEQAVNWEHPDQNSCTGTYEYQGHPVHISMYGMSEEKIQSWISIGAEIVKFPERGSINIDNLWD